MLPAVMSPRLLHQRAPRAPTPSDDRRALQALLRSLENLSLAALLRELGVELYNREIIAWRMLTDISDELLDRETVAARTRIAQRLAKAPPRPRRVS